MSVRRGMLRQRSTAQAAEAVGGEPDAGQKVSKIGLKLFVAVALSLPVLATLEDLDEAALKKILQEPKNALVKQYQRLFEMENVDLTFHENALSAIASIGFGLSYN